MEAARPQTAGEEELQLQLALAMSREEAEQEESKTKSDDMRLKMALEKSKQALYILNGVCLTRYIFLKRLGLMLF